MIITNVSDDWLMLREVDLLYGGFGLLEFLAAALTLDISLLSWTNRGWFVR
jgi:hypothetical protein